MKFSLAFVAMVGTALVAAPSFASTGHRASGLDGRPLAHPARSRATPVQAGEGFRLSGLQPTSGGQSGAPGQHGG